MMTLPGEQPTETSEKSTASNFNQRVMTALITLPIVLAAVFIGGWLLTILLGAVMILGLLEFYILARGTVIQGSALVGVPTAVVVLLAFHLEQPSLWIAALVAGLVVTFILETIRHPRQIRRSLLQASMTMAGVLYVGFPCAFIVAIRDLPDGLIWLMTVLMSTWGTDTLAYFGGRQFGKTKLAPVLSPKKTVEGAVIGMIGGMICALIVLAIGGKLSFLALAMVIIAAPVAVGGDLFESALKRFFHIKDSHINGLDILPGHGGVLDRIDALVVVTTVCYLFIGFIRIMG